MKTKKELKDEYRQLKFRMGVFQIRNTVNGKIFIDGSVNLDAIYNRHRMQLNSGMHPNVALQNDWNHYGESSFIYETLTEIQEKDGETIDYGKEVKELAAMYIDESKPYEEKGYNKSK